MKKIYRDEKGRFCKRHNSVEEKPKRKKRKKEWREANLEREKAKRRERYQANKETYANRQRVWRSNPEKRGMLRAQWASTRAKRLQREISLDEAGRKEIAKIFAGCPEGWHVDHIAPMLGDTISGLHHPDNLQYLPEWANYMKGNRWEESWIEHTIDTPVEEKIKAYQLNYEGGKWHE